MQIRKAVITAAGRNQRALPLHTLVDRDGQPKAALRIVLEEAASAGIEEIGIVICPGDREAYAKAAGELAAKVHFIEQDTPRGYGHALYCAHDFTGDEAFLHLVGDHLPLSRAAKRCAAQLVDVATAEACAVSAVQPTRESLLTHYGTVGGRRVPQTPDLYEIDAVVEKPTPTEAEQTLLVPGLRAGYYLCFFGMHVLTPTVMALLGELAKAAPAEQPLQLSAALARLVGRERYLAFQVQGTRYDIGRKYGLLQAQLAFGLSGHDHDEVLTVLVETLAQRERLKNTDPR